MLDKFKRFYIKFQIGQSPQANLVWGFFLYVLLGFILLLLPWFHKNPVPVIDNLFTAVSAVSTTGLVTINIFENYTFFGQLIILSLFQIGG